MSSTSLRENQYNRYQSHMDTEEPKDVQLKAMVTATQKRRWERAAKIARRSLSDWLRVTLDDAADSLISNKGLEEQGGETGKPHQKKEQQ